MLTSYEMWMIFNDSYTERSEEGKSLFFFFFSSQIDIFTCLLVYEKLKNYNI